MNIVYTKKFKRIFYKLPKSVRSKAVEREAIFQRYPFTKTLKTHKLSGKLSGYYAFSVNYNYRIIFKYLNKYTIAFVYIGDHSVYE